MPKYLLRYERTIEAAGSQAAAHEFVLAFGMSLAASAKGNVEPLVADLDAHFVCWKVTDEDKLVRCPFERGS
jgi:hypothetical protein